MLSAEDCDANKRSGTSLTKRCDTRVSIEQRILIQMRMVLLTVSAGDGVRWDAAEPY